ncbi:MAG: Rid family hydrolase [Thermoanaerobaculia bacterium]
MKHLRFTTDTPGERRFDYARAVRAGSFIAVSATADADAEGRPTATDVHGQTLCILRSIDETLQRAGSKLSDVVRLRVHYADPDIAEDFRRALRDVFPEGAPALSTLRVVALSSPLAHLEIEADAVVAEARPRGQRELEGDEQAD